MNQNTGLKEGFLLFARNFRMLVSMYVS